MDNIPNQIMWFQSFIDIMGPFVMTEKIKVYLCKILNTSQKLLKRLADFDVDVPLSEILMTFANELIPESIKPTELGKHGSL